MIFLTLWKKINIIIKNINIIIKAYKIKINENKKMDLMIYISNLVGVGGGDKK
jgi:hypothetical protein